MDYKNKLKKRLYVAVAYIVIGAITAGYAIIANMENEFFFAYGIALVVCGIIRIRQYIKLIRSEENMRKQEIAEKDERNIAIMNKARSWAFSLYVIVVGVAVIILEIMGKQDIATAAALSVCVLILLFWVSYHIVARKM